jgi:hypothetical protein
VFSHIVMNELRGTISASASIRNQDHTVAGYGRVPVAELAQMDAAHQTPRHIDEPAQTPDESWVRLAPRKWMFATQPTHWDEFRIAVGGKGGALKVEQKFGWDVAYGMDCDGLRITADVKAVLP